MNLRYILQRVDNFVDLFGAGEKTLLDGLVEEERSGAGGSRGHASALTSARRNAASDLLDKLLAVIVADVQILRKTNGKPLMS